jgi:hypothetical protein
LQTRGLLRVILISRGLLVRQATLDLAHTILATWTSCTITVPFIITSITLLLLCFMEIAKWTKEDDERLLELKMILEHAGFRGSNLWQQIQIQWMVGAGQGVTPKTDYQVASSDIYFFYCNNILDSNQNSNNKER